MYNTSLKSVTAEIEDLLVEKFSARGRDLKAKLKSAGRRLPRRIRSEAEYLVEAEARCANPKRASQYDPARVVEAHRRCVAYLQKLDTRIARSRRRTSIMASILVNLLLLAMLAAAGYSLLP
ncbi:MAG: hypothetical protein K8F59_08845 [Rhodobacteraceae bacterium]|nr:hypothetical protein [Paracoccaceae bacterium]